MNIYINDAVTLYELGIKYLEEELDNQHFFNVDKDDKREVNFSGIFLIKTDKFWGTNHKNNIWMSMIEKYSKSMKKLIY